MEESDVPQLSTDSFVDTVANTVGMLIVFTVITVAITHRRASEVDPELEKLHRRRADVEKAEKELPRLEAEISRKRAVLAGLTARHVDVSAERDRARASHERVRSSLEELARRENALAVELEELAATYKRDSEDVARAQEEKTRAASEFSQEELSNLQRRSPEELSAELERLVSEKDSASAGAAAASARRVELSELVRTLQEKKSALEKTIAELASSGLVKLTITPPTGEELFKDSIWVECFVQPGVGPSVRVIDEKNYTRESIAGSKYALRAIAPGEALSDALGETSSFRRYLQERTKLQTTHSVKFLVRPDAYAAFIALRKLVIGDGWRVQWEPIELGELIKM